MRLQQLGRVIIFAAALLAGCDGSNGTDDSDEVITQTFQWSGQIEPGDQVEVKGVAGDVTFTPSTGNDIDVDAVKTGTRDHPSSVTIEIVEHTDGVRICALYPDVPGQPPNECTPTGNLSSRRNDVEVDFTVRVPPGRKLKAGVIGGDMTALGMANDVVLSTLGGNVVISTSHIGEASTFGGNITVTLGSTTPGRNLRFSSLGGDVRVTLPAAVNAEVDLSTLSGAVSSDFSLTQVGPDHLVGTLGSGGAMLTLSSTAGNVRLLSAP